jgi:hypothetical protein
MPDLDLTDAPFVTLDPRDAVDLDQALHIERDDDGYVVRYAIADMAAFVVPDGLIDREAHRRGETLCGADPSSAVPAGAVGGRRLGAAVGAMVCDSSGSFARTQWCITHGGARERCWYATTRSRPRCTGPSRCRSGRRSACGSSGPTSPPAWSASSR